MDADGDYIPKSVLNGNARSIVAWNAWKVEKYGANSKVMAPKFIEHGVTETTS